MRIGKAEVIEAVFFQIGNSGKKQLLSLKKLVLFVLVQPGHHGAEFLADFFNQKL